MYQKERIENIMKILEENGYVTVKYLTGKLHYSTATINRDLNVMESMQMAVRSYGGVEIPKDSPIPLQFRYHKEESVKRKIAKAAADFICDGDTVYIDGATTSEYIGNFIAGKKNITVITNNMALVKKLTEKGIYVVCTGGTVCDPPYILDGPDAVRTALRYNTDKLFFSAYGVSNSGRIFAATQTHSTLDDAARKNAKKVYFLIDRSKINMETKYITADFSEVDTVISNYKFPDATKAVYKNTGFIEVE